MPTDNDPEIHAMSSISAVLEPLDGEARNRVLTWANTKFGLRSQFSASREPGTATTANSQQAFGDFAELFAAANPKTASEQALVAGYWVQVCGRQPSFPSQTLNTMLKDLGRGVSNITKALESLKDEKPALVLQLKKSGSSKQARKIYKLTQEGMKRVISMISGEGNE